MSTDKLAEALPHFDDMTALQRRLHNAAIVLGADGDEYGFEGLLREAIVALAAHEAEQEQPKLYTSPKLRALIDGFFEQGAVALVHWPIDGPPRIVWTSRQSMEKCLSMSNEGAPDMPLYTRPQQPLTEREILDLVPSAMPIANDFDLLWFARAIERAHGITKDASHNAKLNGAEPLGGASV